MVWFSEYLNQNISLSFIQSETKNPMLSHGVQNLFINQILMQWRSLILQIPQPNQGFFEFRFLQWLLI